MIYIEDLFRFLRKKNINFFTGVPDSVLKKTNNIFSKMKENNHIIAANEGNALAIAAGHYLATKKIPLVYFQNSGLGNLINPLTSVVHKNVYSIPMVFLIGWRGHPNTKDEAQHFLMGKITTKLLKLINIKYQSLNNFQDLKKINLLINYSKKNNTPVAILIKQNTLKEKLLKKNNIKKDNKIKRIDYLDFILKKINKNSKIFSTTGYTSRELFYLNKKKFNNKLKCFYNVGGMGHTSSLALGYSLKSLSKVLCLDGDGSLLMHMGALTNIAKQNKTNFKHILFNNYGHESVGGQPTLSKNIDFRKMTNSLKYKNFYFSKNLNSFKKKFSSFINSKGPSFFEVRIKPGTIDGLPRPKNFLQIKKYFYEN